METKKVIRKCESIGDLVAGLSMLCYVWFRIIFPPKDYTRKEIYRQYKAGKKAAGW